MGRKEKCQQNQKRKCVLQTMSSLTETQQEDIDNMDGVVVEGQDGDLEVLVQEDGVLVGVIGSADLPAHIVLGIQSPL